MSQLLPILDAHSEAIAHAVDEKLSQAPCRMLQRTQAGRAAALLAALRACCRDSDPAPAQNWAKAICDEAARLDLSWAEVLTALGYLERVVRACLVKAVQEKSAIVAVTAELADVRSHVDQEPNSSGIDGAQLKEMLQEFQQDRAELHNAQEAFRSEMEQLASVAGELATARTELTQARDEIVKRREQLESVRGQAESGQPNEQLEEQFRQMEQQQAQLEQERAILEAELEAVRNRAAEMSDALAAQKRQISQQQNQWAEELKRMRRLLEGMSGRLMGGEQGQDVGPKRSVRKAAAAAAEDAAPDQEDTVLDSVMVQFEMLQKDRARRRAAKA